jgi:hypothetical protein
MFERFLNALRLKKKPDPMPPQIQPAVRRYSPSGSGLAATSRSQDDGDFGASMAVGMATNNAMLGYMAGGSLAGGIAGDMARDGVMGSLSDDCSSTGTSSNSSSSSDCSSSDSGSCCSD